MPEALREKLVPAFGYTEQATCNPIVKDEYPNPARLLQRERCSGLGVSRRAAHFGLRPRGSVRRCLPNGPVMIRRPLKPSLQRALRHALRRNLEHVAAQDTHGTTA